MKDLTKWKMDNPEEINNLMAKGNLNRSVAATAMNATSSRSHSIFMLEIETSEPDPAVGKVNSIARSLHLFQ